MYFILQNFRLPRKNLVLSLSKSTKLKQSINIVYKCYIFQKSWLPRENLVLSPSKSSSWLTLSLSPSPSVFWRYAIRPQNAGFSFTFITITGVVVIQHYNLYVYQYKVFNAFQLWEFYTNLRRFRVILKHAYAFLVPIFLRQKVGVAKIGVFSMCGGYVPFYTLLCYFVVCNYKVCQSPSILRRHSIRPQNVGFQIHLRFYNF